MNASRIAFFAAFKPLRLGAEKMMAPSIKEARVFLNRLGKMMLLSGQIVDTDMNYGYMCRTRVEVKLNGSVVNFLDESLGNHLAMVLGDVVERLVEVCDLLACMPVMRARAHAEKQMTLLKAC